jgi:hypothetical protein
LYHQPAKRVQADERERRRVAVVQAIDDAIIPYAESIPVVLRRRMAEDVADAVMQLHDNDWKPPSVPKAKPVYGV